MDVISIPDIKTAYRVIPSRKGLILNQLTTDEVGFKLCRIEGKTVTDGGHIQLNFHDGRNILIRVNDSANMEEDVYRTLDTVKISIPSQEVIEHVRMAEGASTVIIGGKNAGRCGKLVSIEEKQGQRRRNWLTLIEDGRGERFQTILDYVFIVGDVEPSISLPEVN